MIYKINEDILQIFEVPTGKIAIINSECECPIEFLSIGDYGKDVNIKADFLGLSDKIYGVPNGEIMPLEEKWVITISTQTGCSSKCNFCDVPKVGPGNNISEVDLASQVINGLRLFPNVKSTKRLNIHFARMGEPTFNPAVLQFSKVLKNVVGEYLGDTLIHPVISTMLPKYNVDLNNFLNVWTNEVKNDFFDGDAGLQFSINSTSDKQRDEMFGGSSLSLSEISKIGKLLPTPKGRKYTLNFALADEYEVDAKKLCELFDPKKFIVKITPLHFTSACLENNIKTSGGYSEYLPYEKAEMDLKVVGFDVLVFIPSEDEDKSRITCGNAILSGTLPETDYKVY